MDLGKNREESLTKQLIAENRRVSLLKQELQALTQNPRRLVNGRLEAEPVNGVFPPTAPQSSSAPVAELMRVAYKNRNEIATEARTVSSQTSVTVQPPSGDEEEINGLQHEDSISPIISNWSIATTQMMHANSTSIEGGGNKVWASLYL